ncbi:hypothetical protein TURU_156417 [Turdus rufiventris]|nr:hypothetical protein TURU_156417 [Turdus rufiventris]
MYLKRPAGGLAFCLFYLASSFTNKVANIGGWTSASHLLEAGLGGDKLVFKLSSNRIENWFLVPVKLGPTASYQLYFCDFHSYFGATLVAMDPP